MTNQADSSSKDSYCREQFQRRKDGDRMQEKPVELKKFLKNMEIQRHLDKLKHRTVRKNAPYLTTVEK